MNNKYERRTSASQLERHRQRQRQAGPVSRSSSDTPPRKRINQQRNTASGSTSRSSRPGNRRKPNPNPSRQRVQTQSQNRPTSSGSYQPYVRSNKNRTLERFAPLLRFLGILLAIYLIGIIYFSFHFLPGSIVNGKEVGGMRISKAEDLISQDLDSHVLTLVELEEEESIDPAEINLKIRVGKQISKACKSQGKASWPFRLFGKKKKTVDLDISYDKEKLEEVINHLHCFTSENIVAPANAYIKAGDSKFQIEPEVFGNTVDREALHKAIEHGFATGKTKIDLKKKNLYVSPTVYQDDKRLKAALKTANKYAKSVVNYNFTYTTEVCDYSVFKNWIVVTDDFEVIYRDDDLDEYMTTLGSKYNTVGASRNFTNYNGETITITEGDYGWKINSEQEMPQLNKDLKTGKQINRKPIYLKTAQAQNGPADDIGNSYVEVSIPEQMVYLFVDGKKIISSPVVTGDTEKKRDTHTGIYGITYKQRNAILTGEGYSSPVSYWMPFNGNEGLHDAPWRENFGGYIYQGAGSHGCVNCPPGVAAKIYQYVKTGFPVIVY